MKKQHRKLHFTKSKIAHFKTLHLLGGTDDASLNPYSNNYSNQDCGDTLMTCDGTDCNTHGRPRTRNDSPCGDTNDQGFLSNDDCLETAGTNC